MICLVWAKIYTFFETHSDKDAGNRVGGVGQKKWTFFFLFKFITFKAVFPAWNILRESNLFNFFCLRYWDVVRSAPLSHPPCTQLPFANSLFWWEVISCLGAAGHPGIAPMTKIGWTLKRVLDVEGEHLLISMSKELTVLWTNSIHGSSPWMYSGEKPG